MTARDEILTVGEVAMELRCSRTHIYKVIHGQVPGVSQLPAISVGRKMLVRRSTLERWKCANESGNGNDMLAASFKVGAVDA